MIQTAKITCLFAQARKYNLILPSSAVAEVVVSPIETNSKYDKNWLAGCLNWNQSLLPIILFDQLELDDHIAQVQKVIILIVRNPDANHKLPHLGIVAKNTPQLIEANTHNIGESTKIVKDHKYSKAHFSYNSHTVYVPDIPAIASLILSKYPVFA